MAADIFKPILAQISVKVISKKSFCILTKF